MTIKFDVTIVLKPLASTSPFKIDRFETDMICAVQDRYVFIRNDKLVFTRFKDIDSITIKHIEVL